MYIRDLFFMHYLLIVCVFCDNKFCRKFYRLLFYSFMPRFFLITVDFLHQSPQILGFSNPTDFHFISTALVVVKLASYKTDSITANLLLLTSLFNYYVVTYKESTAETYYRLRIILNRNRGMAHPLSHKCVHCS